MCVVHVIAICAKSLLLLLSFLRCLPFIPLVPWCILSLSCLFGLRQASKFQTEHAPHGRAPENTKFERWRPKQCRHDNTRAKHAMEHVEMQKNEISCPLRTSRKSFPMPFKTLPDTFYESQKLPGRFPAIFEKTRKFMKFSTFFVHAPSLVPPLACAR